jgi:hypothetical protein
MHSILPGLAGKLNVESLEILNLRGTLDAHIDEG